MDASVRQSPACFVREHWPAQLGCIVLLLVLGVAQALAMAWPFAGSWQGQASGTLQLGSLIGFALLLQASTSPKQAFVRGWWFATGWLVASIWWLYISMHVYGGMPSSLAALAVFLLAAGLALFLRCGKLGLPPCVRRRRGGDVSCLGLLCCVVAG